MVDIKPTIKSDAIEAYLFTFYGKDRRVVINNRECIKPDCNTRDITRDSFKDELSIREYNISAMCQSCQNEFFGDCDDPNCYCN